MPTQKPSDEDGPHRIPDPIHLRQKGAHEIDTKYGVVGFLQKAVARLGAASAAPSTLDTL